MNRSKITSQLQISLSSILKNSHISTKDKMDNMVPATPVIKPSASDVDMDLEIDFLCLDSSEQDSSPPRGISLPRKSFEVLTVNSSNS